MSETTTLGKINDGEAPKLLIGDIELAVGEEADFDTAQKAMEEQRYDEAAEMFSRFGKTYQPAHLGQRRFCCGKALEANEDTKGAARAYLSFTNYQNSAVAPEALTLLGKALVKLGRIEAGCRTLSQVEIRFLKRYLQGCLSGHEVCGMSLESVKGLADRFKDSLSRLLEGSPRSLLLAVSGGSDSMALMYLAAAWAKEHGVPCSVITVDHGLRAESVAEAEFVKVAAQELGLAHNILRWNRGTESRGNLQKNARDARYGLIAEYGETAQLF